MSEKGEASINVPVGWQHAGRLRDSHRPAAQACAQGARGRSLRLHVREAGGWQDSSSGRVLPLSPDVPPARAFTEMSTDKRGRGHGMTQKADRRAPWMWTRSAVQPTVSARRTTRICVGRRGAPHGPRRGGMGSRCDEVVAGLRWLMGPTPRPPCVTAVVVTLRAFARDTPVAPRSGDRFGERLRGSTTHLPCVLWGQTQAPVTAARHAGAAVLKQAVATDYHGVPRVGDGALGRRGAVPRPGELRTRRDVPAPVPSARLLWSRALLPGARSVTVPTVPQTFCLWTCRALR